MICQLRRAPGTAARPGSPTAHAEQVGSPAGRGPGLGESLDEAGSARSWRCADPRCPAGLSVCARPGRRRSRPPVGDCPARSAAARRPYFSPGRPEVSVCCRAVAATLSPRSRAAIAHPGLKPREVPVMNQTLSLMRLPNTFRGSPFPPGSVADMSRASLDKDPRDVASMFDAVARRYDITNTVLSAGQDWYWRRATRRALDLKPGDTVLDPATGTAVSTVELAKSGPACGRRLRWACCTPGQPARSLGRRRRHQAAVRRRVVPTPSPSASVCAQRRRPLRGPAR